MINRSSEALVVDYPEKMKALAQQIGYSTKQSSKVIHPSLRQCTLKRSISFQGIGQSSKNHVVVTLRPAPDNTGIISRRVDLYPVCVIPATIQSVSVDAAQVNLIRNNIYIKGIEHLLSAFSGLGIDNAYVDIAGDEVPILDGSACPFVFLIESAGIASQSALKNFIRIKDTVKIAQGNAIACIEPYGGFRMHCSIDNQHDIPKHYEIESSSCAYRKEIIRARHQAASLAQCELRYQDEALRHLVLDMTGYLYTLGCQIIGSIRVHQTENTLHYFLIEHLLQQPHAWEYVTFIQGQYSTQQAQLMVHAVS